MILMLGGVVLGGVVGIWLGIKILYWVWGIKLL
jgi:hypothetical protein